MRAWFNARTQRSLLRRRIWLAKTHCTDVRVKMKRIADWPYKDMPAFQTTVVLCIFFMIIFREDKSDIMR